MTVQQQLSAAEQFTQLWTALMPGFGIPEPEQVLLWVGTYPPDLVSRGVNRAAAKVRKMRDTAPMTLNAAIRYATSVMRNEALGIRQHI